MSNDNDYGESNSWVRGAECNGGRSLLYRGRVGQESPGWHLSRDLKGVRVPYG